MWKFIQFELKKIFKHRLNILLCILTIGLNFFFLTQIIDIQITDQSGKTYTKNESIEIVNNFYKEHAGIVNDDYVLEMNKEYQKQYDAYMEDKIDFDMMVNIFGKNYEEMRVLGENALLTREKMLAYVDQVKNNCIRYGIDVPMAWSDENSHFRIFNIYKENAEILPDYEKTLKNIFYSYSSSNNEQMYFEILNNSEDMKIKAYEEDGNLIVTDMGFLKLTSFNPEYLDRMTINHIQWLNDKYEKVDSAIDSTLSSNIFIRILEYYPIYVVYLILIVVLCSNIFSIDYENKTNQIIVCSNKNKTVLKAKILTMLFIVSTLFLVTFLIVVLYITHFIPIENLHLQAIDLGFGLGSNGTNALYSCIELIGYQLCMLYFAYLSIGVISVGLSCFTKSKFVSGIITLLSIFLPIFCQGQKWITFSPFIMINSHHAYFNWDMWMNDVLPVQDIGGFMIHTFSIVCLIWSLISLVILTACYLKERKHIV